MKFKKNILGLAVAVVTTFSVSAIANEIPKPDAFENVDATVLESTEAALNGKGEYTKVATARTAVTNTAGALDTALGDQADKNKQIADAQAAITAANALTAGQLIGGQTKAEILKDMNEDLGQTAAGVPDGTGYLFDIVALDTAASNATKSAADAAAALAAIETGAISNQLSSAAGYKAAAQAQDTDNGTVATGSAAKTLGKILFDAEDALGVAEVNGGAANGGTDATGLYFDVVDANKDVVDAKALITGGVLGTDAYTGNPDYQAAAVPGTKSASTFTIADTNMLDLRDGDTQLTFTVGTTTANDEAALIKAINDEEGFSFTATAGTGAGEIILTYDDAETAVQAYAGWDTAKKAARTAVANISTDSGTSYADGATVSVAGVDYTAANPLTYDLHVANMELAASDAAAALQVGIASEQLAQANYDAGLDTKAAHLTAETAAYAAAATAYTQVDSVLQEQLAQQNVVVAGNEATAVTAETAAAEDLADVTSTAAALEVATTAETAAAADVAAAQAAYTATGGATAENLAALNAATTAKTAATAVKTAAATAATAATDAYYGPGKTAATAIDLQNGTNAAAVSARKGVVTSQTLADGLSAQRALQVQIAADATNPAAVLQAALVAGKPIQVEQWLPQLTLTIKRPRLMLLVFPLT